MIVEELKFYATRKFVPQFLDLRRHGIGNRNRVAGGLAGDVEQHRVFTVCRDCGVDGHGAVFDGGNVGYAHRRASRGCLYHQLS